MSRTWTIGRRSPAMRWVPVAVLAVVLAAATVAIPPAARAGQPVPALDGPQPPGHFGENGFEVASIGYQEAEYFLSGTARSYADRKAAGEYRTRAIVVRPNKERDFNGTVVVEWNNVSSGIPSTPMWFWLHHLLLERGYAYVGLDAQRAPSGSGPQTLQLVDPGRYGELSHPGDDFSFDILTQTVASTKRRGGLLGPLRARRAVAVGNSQSAMRLRSYLDVAAAETGVLDAVLLDAGVVVTAPGAAPPVVAFDQRFAPSLGTKQFARQPVVPTIELLSEEGLEPSSSNATVNYRLWEVPGASHNDADTSRHVSSARGGGEKQPYREHRAEDRRRHYGEQGLSGAATCVPAATGNEYPRRYAVAAAVHWLDRWARTGRPAPGAPRVVYDAAGSPVRDQHGNVRGGLRLPPIDVPVATYLGASCGLFGTTTAFDPARLAALYPTHELYLAKLKAATHRAVRAGHLLPADAADFLATAAASDIGR